MTRTENFLSHFFSKFFWKPLFSPFYGTLFIISRKYFFGFSKSAPTPRYTNQKVQLQLDFLLLIKKSPATALDFFISIVYKGLKSSKSIFFQSFSGNHFSPRFMVPCSLLAKNGVSMGRCGVRTSKNRKNIFG